MTKPTETIPRRGASYTPDSDKPPRKSNRATVVAAKMSDARKAHSWKAFIVGASILGVNLWKFLEHEGPSTALDYGAHAGFLLLALALMGMIEVAVDGLAKLERFAKYLPWGKKDGAS